jgi:chorismate-pyruvate lyase
MSPVDLKVDVESLVGLFHENPDALGPAAPIHVEEAPPVERSLLAHTRHMTVTVEKHHGCPVEVRVLNRQRTGTHYAREILLTRASDGQVVQYGIMRVRLNALTARVRDEILAEATPLGRVLIERGVLRRIHLVALWRFVASSWLARALGCPAGTPVYGRTAIIECDGEPAVELLEIVAPAVLQAAAADASPVSP